MKGKLLIILGSSRKQSDTRNFLEKVFHGSAYTLIDLLDFKISTYNYSGTYRQNDMFKKVMDSILQHELIVFATPVYWYAMSGIMKVFFDRFTDLVTIDKKIGRQLKGKKTYLLAVGSEKELPGGFETPFKLTSEYFDMTYKGCIYHSTKFPLMKKRDFNFLS